MKKLPPLQLLNFEQFSTLSQMEKRVAIAQDVIARISAGKIQAIQGSLFQSKSGLNNDKTSLQQSFNQNLCEVCAKGGLICSWVGNFNKYNDIYDFSEDVEQGYPAELIEIFGKKLLDAIEVCFEGKTYPWHNEEFDEYIKDNIDFRNIPTLFNKYKNNSNRLKAIMQNIIDNQGILEVTKTLTVG